MDYNKIYNDLISKAQLENRIKGGDIYYEAHHILPKCIGGEGNESQWKTHPNIILLTGREHFVAHKLLVEMHPNNHSLMWALHRMMFSKNKKTERLYNPSSRDYERFRVEFSKMVSKQQSNVPKSEEHRKNLSKSKKGTKMSESFINNLKETMKGENNPNYGNKWTEDMKQNLSRKKKGVPSKVVWTDEMREMVSNKTKGKYNGTEETKKKISQTLTGRKASNETKEKQSKKRKEFLKNNPNYGKGPQKLITCPHCNKTGGHSNMTRYHFDNCKHKVFI
jgi:hypothetical protein